MSTLEDTPGTLLPSKKSRFFATSRGMSSAKHEERRTARFFSTNAGPSGLPNGCASILIFSSQKKLSLHRQLRMRPNRLRELRD